MAPDDAELARLAGALRVLKLEQLRAAGLSRKAIRHRVDSGRLQRLWPSVYLVGPGEADPLSVVYGATASFTGDVYADRLWGCFVHSFAPPPDPPVDVLVVTGTRHKRKGVLVHRCETLGPDDVGHLGAIPVVSPARAILGAAETSSASRVEALVA
jgi:hypothetical protein